MVTVILVAIWTGLAVLLRAVKLWASDAAVALIRFHLDGRSYVLESGIGLLTTAA